MTTPDFRSMAWARARDFFNIPMVPISDELIREAQRFDGTIRARRLDNRYINRIPVFRDNRWMVLDRHEWHKLAGARDHEYVHHLRWPGRPNYLFTFRHEEPPVSDLNLEES